MSLIPPDKTKYNQILKKDVFSKAGRKICYYLITCANPNCNQTFLKKICLWNQQDIDFPSIYCCSRQCKRTKEVVNLETKRRLDKFGYTSHFALKEMQDLAKQRVFEKFGVENVFQSEEIKQKIYESNIEKYGFKSPQQNPEFKAKVFKTVLEKYGKENLMGAVPYAKTMETVRKRFGSDFYFTSKAGIQNKEGYLRRHGKTVVYKKWRENCAGKAVTLEKMISKYGPIVGTEKYDQFLNDIKQNEENFIKRHGEIDGPILYAAFRKRATKRLLKNGRFSSFNNRVYEALVTAGLDVEREFGLSANNRTYFYDFRYNDYLIEANGDFWHANPKKYKDDDVLNWPGNRKILASSVWLRDQEKEEVAASKGHKVLSFWESDFTENPEETINILKDQIFGPRSTACTVV